MKQDSDTRVNYQYFRSEGRLMEFPITDINRQVWNKKVSCASMYTIPAEDEALPVLQELETILLRLLSQPLQETLGQNAVEYFFVNVIPVVCQKLIRSRYFKSHVVLKLANSVLENSVYLVPKYLEVGVRWPKFLETLIIVFSTDEFYFKNNNQLNHMNYPHLYFKHKNDFGFNLTVGDRVDVLKSSSMSDKISWSRGEIIACKGEDVEIAYLNDCHGKKITHKWYSQQIAPYLSKTTNYEWRFQLKVGDKVDCEDGFGSWYNGTVFQVIDKGEDRKMVKVTLKVYDQSGNKHDENGKFFGFSDYDETYDVTSPKIQPFCSICKEFAYESSKSSYDTIDDINDHEFDEFMGERVYAFPRKKYLSEFMFKTINKFGQMGGFDKILEFLENNVNFDVLSFFVKGISGIAPYLHRTFVKEFVPKLKKIIEKFIFQEPEKMSKDFTKEKSEMVFSGLRILQKRVYNNDFVYQYENRIKMKLVDSCLQSEALKKKLQGLNQLKDIVKSVIYTSEKNRWIKEWVKENKIFDKIYLVNSHVQLIKKSEEFFKYLINEDILEVNDLQTLYKMAQKGDYQSRISLYRLFQQVSHIFKKQHVEYLIDTILESQLQLILNEDIDLLHELSRFSNYFPLEKVIKFFENIILRENKVKELNDYAIKKYSQIVARNFDMRPKKRDIIRNFLERLTTHDITQVTKVLKGIFEGIGIGEAGKRQLNQILSEENVDVVAVAAIKTHKQTPDFNKAISKILELLLSIYKMSFRVKIKITTMKTIWELLEGNQEKQRQFYKWANEVVKCDQGLDDDGSTEFEEFYRKLFAVHKIHKMKTHEFELAKNIFGEINKKARLFSVSNVIREKEVVKEYKRKVSLHQVKLMDVLIQIIYFVEDEEIRDNSLTFFMDIYNSKDNSQQQIDDFFDKLLKKFKQHYAKEEYKQLEVTLKLIEIVIDDSEKFNQTSIVSLSSKKKSEPIRFLIINELSYASDSVKKQNMEFPLNLTLMQLRKLLAKEFSVPWREVKIVGIRELKDHENSRTLKELKLNPNHPLTVSRRILSSHQDIELMPGDKMEPRAVRCFKVIFDRYSTNNLMSKEQCNSFTAVCLGASSSSKYYSEKISSLYNTYDKDQDGYLQFEEFINFYEDAARDRPSTVWSNLRSFGVRSNLRFMDQPDEEVILETFPRKYLTEDKQIFNILFGLLKVQKLALLAFELLQRLPISKQIEQEFLSINEQADIQKVFSITDPYTYLYKLKVLEIMIQTPKEGKHSQQRETFIKNSGFEQILYKINILLQSEEFSIEADIYKEILLNSMELLLEYWMEIFMEGSEKLPESIALMKKDYQIDEKIEYLVTGAFPKKEQKLELPDIHLIGQDSVLGWKGPNNTEISTTILNLLEILWNNLREQLSQSKKKESTLYLSEMIVDKCMVALNILFINQNPQQLIKKLSELLEKLPKANMVVKIYTLILCLCFYSEIKYQGFYIKQMFRNLTKTNITFEHFRVLAVLVSKYGISGNGDSEQSLEDEQSEKMREILLDNILNNTNELTIEGCGKLLCNFQLKSVPLEAFLKIWSHRLFNPQTICKKEQTKKILYELILKIASSNPEYMEAIIDTVQSTIEDKSIKMKITYCNQFKERSNNGFAGIKNLGNICYMISMIQQLFMNKTFRYLLLRVNDQKEQNIVEYIDKEVPRMVDDNFLHQIQKIFAYLDKTNRIDYVPKDFCYAYKPFGEPVNVMIQQDVQEFVSMFFDRLQQGISETPLKNLVNSFYVGKSVNLFSCHECRKAKKIEDTFHSITLEVKNSKTLTDSFNRYILGELISDYTCDFCEKKVDVTKRTRIMKNPKVLIIHLQRIVFNLDTFINEKISTKHSFPHELNLYPYTLEYFDRTESGETDIPVNHDYDYNLIGIICHTGNAESGHYISYIKTENNKWYQFNDSLINTFNPNNIESECFGGLLSSYDDDYDWDKRQNSKSAYILIYERQGENKIQLVLKNLEEKNVLLTELQLQEIIENIQEKAEEQARKQAPTQSQEQSSQIPQDSEKETKLLMEQKELEIKRQLSEDNIEVNKQEPQMQKKEEEKQQIIVKIKDNVHPFLPQNLINEVEEDNVIHFFERSLSSSAFSEFFAKLLTLDHQKHKQLLPLCQRLTFGFWLKSPSFKELLVMIDNMINHYPDGFTTIVLENPAIINLLIEYSDGDVRTNMANFLAKTLSDVIQKKSLQLEGEQEDDKAIVKFLDHLFDLLPTTVSKCWTKFSQYFEFWDEFASRGEVQIKYMLKKEMVKHFMDYFLDTKSPLKIYATKRQHTIGSSYTSPNFSMLLRCVSTLLQKNMHHQNEVKLSAEEEMLLMSCESLEKLISDKYEHVAAKLVRQVCPNNLAASQKAALVILKGVCKSNYETIQPYLEVLHEFVLIEDGFQDLRIKWVIGKQTLALSTYSKKLIALNSYSFDERIYNFDSSFYIEGGTSLLEMLFVYYKKIQNYSMLCLKELLRLCEESSKIRHYIYSLSAPTLSLSKYTDFFKGFIDRYYDESRRGYGFYSPAGLNKEELAKATKEIFQKVNKKLSEQMEKEKKAIKNKKSEEKQQQQKQQQQEKAEVTQNQQKHEQKQEEEQNQQEKQEQKKQNVHQEQEQKQIKQEEEPVKVEKPNSQKALSNEEQRTKEKVPQAVKIDFSDEENEGGDDMQIVNKYENYRTIYGGAGKPIKDDWHHGEDQIVQKEEGGYSYVDEDDGSNRADDEDNDASKQEKYNIHVHPEEEQFADHTKMMELSSEEEEPLIKTSEISGDYPLTWHPVKFDYQCIKEQQYDNFRVCEHESLLTFVLTQPTGLSNRSFISSSGVQKMSERMDPGLFDNQRVEIVHGFFVKNQTRDSLRIQTDDGCACCKPNDSVWVWAEKVQKVWVSDRTIEWPKWSLYSQT